LGSTVLDMLKWFGCLFHAAPASRTRQPIMDVPMHTNSARVAVGSDDSSSRSHFVDSVDTLLAHLAQHDLEPRKLSIVVLGQSLQPDNTPSLSLQNRIMLAVEIHRRTDAPLIVTGADVAGVGRTEADVMRDLLEEHGVQREAICQETKAHNTLENALNIAPMLKEMMCHAVVLVTSEFHLPRAALLCEGVFAHEKVEVQILCMGSPSGHPRLHARTPRPWSALSSTREDISSWRMAERCEHEEILLDVRMRDWFRGYAIAVPPRDRFDAAKARLRAMA